MLLHWRCQFKEDNLGICVSGMKEESREAGVGSSSVCLELGGSCLALEQGREHRVSKDGRMAQGTFGTLMGRG